MVEYGLCMNCATKCKTIISIIFSLNRLLKHKLQEQKKKIDRMRKIERKQNFKFSISSLKSIVLLFGYIICSSLSLVWPPICNVLNNNIRINKSSLKFGTQWRAYAHNQRFTISHPHKPFYIYEVKFRLRLPVIFDSYRIQTLPSQLHDYSSRAQRYFGFWFRLLSFFCMFK